MLYDQDGNPVEGSMTADEAKAAVQTALEQTKQDNEDKLAELNKKIEENTNASLRKKSEAKEKENEQLQKQVEEIRSKVSKQAKDAAIRSLGIKDDDFKKKVEENYDRLKPQDDTDTEAVSKAMQDAYKLSSDTPISALNVATPAAGGAVPSESQDIEQQFSPDFLEMANRGFGLTKEDFKKFGSKIPKEYMN